MLAICMFAASCATVPPLMALVTCSDCSGEISARAPACPHCGAPCGSSYSDPIKNPMPKTEGIFMQSLNLGCLVTLGMLALIAFMMILALGDDALKDSRNTWQRWRISRTERSQQECAAACKERGASGDCLYDCSRDHSD